MKKKLSIEGMCCCKCPGHIKDGLSKVDGIDTIDVDKSNGSAIIELSKDIDDDVLKTAVKESGHYKLTGVESV